MTSAVSKRLTKPLQRRSVESYVRTFDDRIAFTETLRRREEDFASLLQDKADSHKALFADVGGDLQSHRNKLRSFPE